MSSTLEISDDAVWMPQSWIFDALLRRLAPEVEPYDASLADFLLRSQTTHSLELYERFAAELAAPVSEQSYFGFGYCDLRSLDSARFEVLLMSMRKAFDRAVSVGTSAFDPPTAYGDFLISIGVFKSLLRIDPRSGEVHSLSGTITVHDGISWVALDWVYDLVLEHLAAEVSLFDIRFSEVLLAARICDTSVAGSFDLRPVGEDSFKQLLPMAEWMSVRYGPTGGRDAYAPRFDVAFAPRTVELAQHILSDPRAAGYERQFSD